MRVSKQFFKDYWPHLLILLLGLAARLAPGPRTIDDAYITFRYARNLLAGNGLVYNPGELVLGTTTPLYALFMALLGLISGGTEAPFPILAMVFNAVVDSATLLLLIAIGNKLKMRWAGFGAALAWAVAPYSVTFAIGGMETSLTIFLLAACWAAYLFQRYPLTGLLAALAFLARPDTLILVLPLGFDRLFFDPKRRQSPLRIKELLAFFIPVAVWITFASLYFGTPLPSSIAAKADAYYLDSLTALIRFVQHYATPFMENTAFGVPAIVTGLVLYPFLVLLASRYTLKESWANWPFVLFPWAYAAVFSIANPLIFRWYLSPPLPFYILFVLIGLEKLTGDIFSQPNRALRLKKMINTALILIFPFTMLLNNWEIQPDHGLQRPAPAMAWYKLELLYTQIGQALALEFGQLPPRLTLAAGDVGALGYYSGARILDTVGLMSPEAAEYYPLAEELYAQHAYAISPELILDQQPDYFVTLEIYVRTGLLKDPRFLAMYSLREKIETDIYESDGMLIFVKNE